MEESVRRKKFKKIAVNRTNKIIDMIRLLGNCSNKHAYEYDRKDVKQIFDAIDTVLRETKAKFQGQEKTSERFELKE